MAQVHLKDNELFTECIEALGTHNVTILSQEETGKIWRLFKKDIPIYKHGSRIDWNQIKNKNSIEFPDQTIPTLESLLQKPIDTSIYVLWNDASLPVIKTNLHAVLEHFDYVASLGFETWLYNPQEGYIIEYYYLGEMNAGIVPCEQRE